MHLSSPVYPPRLTGKIELEILYKLTELPKSIGLFVVFNVLIYEQISQYFVLKNIPILV